MERSQLISEIAEDLASFKRLLMASWTKKFATRVPTPAQIGILALINHEKPENLKDLAKRLCMTSSAATQLVGGLVEEGLLSSTHDATDRRRIHLALTAAGKRMLIQTKKSRLESLTKLLAPLSEDDLKAWKRMQRKIIDNAALTYE